MSNINIEDFNGFDIKIEYQTICDEYAEKCCDIVRQKSSQFKSTNRERHYMDGWTVKTEKDGEDIYSAIVWNPTDYQLTHLLENGHLIVNKRNGVGWASAHPHIKPSFKEVRNRFISAIKKAEKKITNK